ncbi:DUF1707 SHOCT-like domain-containing protein [Streptomyces fuscigenes]|uniref:DUF1707 SHOCT-like domain-containing protein n=1 Tax=Streptomyces fuscigenes TaxID=1528880 RepID=UPI001F1E0BA0|nr:DUF1707 domain-containing protein [Streptomyces fuscigenes]MCF3962253.1 DUF1707 domain-containing protein [Streptomyces fuscigenes]
MTSELPERETGEGHAPETRASDAEREQVAERLREAVAEGRLDMAEFDERLGLAYTARTHGELVPLVRDLPEPGTVRAVGTAPAAGPAPAGAGAWAGRVGGSEATSRGGFGFMGGFGRRGRWTVGRVFNAVVFMGGGEIDLREARFEGPDTVLRCFAVMGGVQVTVPPDLDVEVRGFGFMGGFGEAPDRREVAGIGPAPDSPKVVVTGFALMGGVGVERKLRKEERRRLKEERKRGRLGPGGESYEDRMARHEDRWSRHEQYRALQEERWAERRARQDALREERRARQDALREERRARQAAQRERRDGRRRGDGFRKEL